MVDSKRDELAKELLAIPDEPSEVAEINTAIVKTITREGTTNLYEDKEELWLDLRNKFIQGKKIPLSNGTYIYKDYTIQEFCTKYSTDDIKLDPARMGKLIKKFKWREYRKSYLEKLSNAELENGLTSELEATYESEVEALTNCKRLNTVLNTYLDFRFGDVLAADEITLDNLANLPDKTQELLTSVNRNTGVPLFLTELKEALTVSERIYSLQRKIIDNNKIDKEYQNNTKISLKATLEKPLLTDGERTKKLQAIKEKLTSKLSNYTDVEVVN